MATEMRVISRDAVLLEAEALAIKSDATSALYVCVLISLISSFLWGYHTAVMSPAEKDTLAGHSETTWSIVVTAMVVGAIVGAFLGGPMSEKLGRKPTVLITGLLNVGAGLGLIFCGESVAVAVTARILCGVAAGLTMCAVPVYIGEIAPPRLRASLNGWPQLANCLGILAAQVLGFYEVEAFGLYATGVALAGLQLLAGSVMARSPEYIINRSMQSGGDLQGAEKEHVVAICRRLYGYTADEAEDHIEVIRRALQIDDVGEGKKSGLFSDSAYAKMTMSVVVLNLAQQLSGFNAILQYSAVFFKPLFANPLLPTVMVGLANLVGSIGTIKVMDVTPRKLLLGISLGGMLLATFAVTMCSGMFVVAAVVAFAMFFQVGLGPLPGCLASEMYDVSRKASAQSLAVVCNNLANFLVTLTFPALYKKFDVLTFVFFGTILFSAFLFSLAVVPETLNKTPEQVYSSISK